MFGLMMFAAHAALAHALGSEVLVLVNVYSCGSVDAHADAVLLLQGLLTEQGDADCLEIFFQFLFFSFPGCHSLHVEFECNT
jgi:hypothetical protein